MRVFILITAMICVGCSKSNREAKSAPRIAIDSLPKSEEFETRVDSSKLVKVNYYENESSYFEKEAYGKFKNWFDTLNVNFVLPPDEARAIFEKGQLQQKFKFKDAPFLVSGFYVLYGHFLKQRNGDNKEEALRQKIKRAFGIVNSIYAKSGEGSHMYYGHQQKSIPAYAEFVVYIHLTMGKGLQREFDIKSQRNLYIQGLKQEVLDAFQYKKVHYSKYPGSMSETDRKAAIDDCFKLIDELEMQIETNFDLKFLQQFQYSHYY